MYLNRINETTVKLIHEAGDELIDWEQLVDGVPLKTFLQPTVCTPINLIRLHHILRDIKDAEADKAAARRARAKPSVVARIATEIWKLPADQQRAIVLLIEAQRDDAYKHSEHGYRH